MRDLLNPKLTALALAALFGALIFMAICVVLSFFPDLSIPLPTGVPSGRLNIGMLGYAPLSYAAVCGALVGMVLILTGPDKRADKPTN
ncbi:hypothetical protein M1D58_27405 (plasmid) [Pseudomonas sp. R4-76]|uniref:hypothetical protein n=1 Tax=unclassified Pseudomonas TaxID=196821 RepID=UPI003DAA43B9